MDTTKTRDELVDMAAAELLIIASGQSLAAEDQETIDSRLDGLIGELSARGICSVTDDDAVPIEWSGALALLLADEAAPLFSKPKMVPDARTIIEDRLRVMVLRQDPPNKYLQVDRALTNLNRNGYPYSRWLRGT